MPIAKGLSSGYLPIGGVMVGDRVADVLIDKGGEFAHGFTYSGHPVACAVAIANLQHHRAGGSRRPRARPTSGRTSHSNWRELAGPSARRRGAIGAA